PLTRHDLRHVLIATIVFAAVLIVCRSARRIRGLLAAVALVGAALALLAFAQQLTHATKVAWHFDIGVLPKSGTFANHSHYGQFMNLSIGCALALLLVRLRGTTTLLSDGYDAPMVQRIRQNIWWPIGVMVIGMATIAMSLTRGGTVAIAAGALFTVALLVSHRGLKAIAGIVLLALLAAFACVL